MALIGAHDGHGDKRCLDCVDSIRLDLPIYEGEDFDCTYCGQAYKEGMSSEVPVEAAVSLQCYDPGYPKGHEGAGWQHQPGCKRWDYSPEGPWCGK